MVVIVDNVSSIRVNLNTQKGKRKQITLVHVRGASIDVLIIMFNLQTLSSQRKCDQYN